MRIFIKIIGVLQKNQEQQKFSDHKFFFKKNVERPVQMFIATIIFFYFFSLTVVNISSFPTLKQLSNIALTDKYGVENCLFNIFKEVSSTNKDDVNAFLVPTFWLFFHFSSYILILPLLVPKSINAFHFSPFC